MAAVDAVQVEAGITGENADSKKAFVLALAAFIVPALDTIASRLDIRLRK